MGIPFSCFMYADNHLIGVSAPQSGTSVVRKSLFSTLLLRGDTECLRYPVEKNSKDNDRDSAFKSHIDP